MHHPPTNGNFSDDHMRLQHMYDLEEWVMNCYLILCQTRKWTKKPFFHFSGTTFLNIFLLLTAWVTKMTHRDFGLYLINWKAKGLPHPCWPLGRRSYMDWSELHKSSAIFFFQTVSLSLFCMWNKNNDVRLCFGECCQDCHKTMKLWISVRDGRSSESQ